MQTNADRSKEYVAVEKDDGSNFAFEYGNIAMLHYSSY